MSTWTHEMPQVVDGADPHKAAIIEALQELLRRAERGEIHSLIAVLDYGNDVGTMFTGCDDLIKRAGMLAIARMDLAKMRDDSSERRGVPK